MKINRSVSFTLCVVVAVATACVGGDSRAMHGPDGSALAAVIEASGAEVGLYYRELTPDGDSILINPDLRMHAASTMKVPVMMQLLLDHQEGSRSFDSMLPVTRTFRSIVDGSEYDLPPESDSDTTFYGQVGQDATIREMVDRMITWSSNLATNILIEVAEPARIKEMLHELEADSMDVLRGVEDLKAFQAGLSNTTTVRSLGTVMAAVHASEAFAAESREIMLDVLSRQHFTGGIPAGVPEGVRVANKTGWITGINHDAAIVFPADGAPYVLVVMVRGHPDEDQGEAMTAELSRIIWEGRGSS
ncbi:MAG: class A beta-lactamase-related serine hydrolase [Longimicrobiales bacterium]|nr:class A beta-lactamase-related serine hydrolase [Longimicrobiales bacterium]